MGLLDILAQVNENASDLVGNRYDATGLLGQLSASVKDWDKRNRLAMQASQSVMPEVRQQGEQKMMANLAPLTGLLGGIGKAGRAVVGGQVADANGFFYKGGQFLPSTAAEPGKWKVDGKWVKSGKREIEPGQWEHQPTPFSTPIMQLVSPGYFSVRDKVTGKLAVNTGLRNYDGSPVTPDMKVQPGVKGVLGKESYTLQELIDMYNNGMRWLDVNPDAVTKTTK